MLGEWREGEGGGGGAGGEAYIYWSVDPQLYSMGEGSTFSLQFDYV